MADLLFLLYTFCYKICVCMEYSDLPREVTSTPMAHFLRFIFTHLGLLSFPSDILVCFMTFSRLRVIWSAEKQKIRNQPRPIVAQVMFAYLFSLLMDTPAFFMYNIKNCTNETMEDAILEGPQCWRYVETAEFTKSPFWPTFVIVKSVITRFLPALAIVCMNILIVRKLQEIWKKKKSLCGLREISNIQNDKTTSNSKEHKVSTISNGILQGKIETRSNFLEVPTMRGINPRRESKQNPKGFYTSLREFRLSVLLVSTLLFYTIFTTPKTVVDAIGSFDVECWYKVHNYRLISALCNVFFTINYSCNFYFYCLANKEIRAAFISLFQ